MAKKLKSKKKEKAAAGEKAAPFAPGGKKKSPLMDNARSPKE